VSVPADGGRSLLRSRISISVLFLTNGVILASWIPHIPAVKQQHGIGDGELGLLRLAMAAGAVKDQPYTHTFLIHKVAAAPMRSFLFSMARERAKSDRLRR